jgi:DTW domain-containing protein YfiP
MFRKSPYLDALPILSLRRELSRYRLRRSKRDDHLCTAEVAALCLDLAGDRRRGLDAYFDVFSQHYLDAKRQLPLTGDIATLVCTLYRRYNQRRLHDGTELSYGHARACA